MSSKSSKAEQIAKDLFGRLSLKIPVNVDAVANKHQITVYLDELEDYVSGLLIVDPGRHMIIINSNHMENRRRFTIAHELGHFFLHRDLGRVFIDDKPLFHRGPKTSRQNWQWETEANIFASELLMPHLILVDMLRQKPLDANDEAAVRRMASRFGVSPQALSIRLTKLGLVA